ncbi:hypothetical protein H0H93_016517 [Arthromyces matolae]|nr:hypothetical protein H0H93_016517 [Arthromyces matolae]
MSQPALSSVNGGVPELVSLIVNAANMIQSHYSKSTVPVIPSLDDTAPHPLDSAISHPELRDAISTLEGACAQLCATVARPNHTVLNKALQFYEPAGLNVVTAFKIPDILQEKPSGMHIEEIAQKAGINAQKLGRVMRLLATNHIFKEVTEDCYANTRLSYQLLSSNPLSSMVSYITSENNKATALLAEVLADPAWGDSDAAGRAPWNKYKGYDKSMFEYFEALTPESARDGAKFGNGMRGWNDASQAAAVVVVLGGVRVLKTIDYPWHELPTGTTVVDVGSGVGKMAMELIKAHPNLHFTLQDLPLPIQQAQTKIWPALLPSALVEKRVDFKPMDFFVESPVAGHNWPDKECIQILKNIRAVLKPGARVLLHDVVLQYACRSEPGSTSELTEAPEPLLPNYGAGRIRQYTLDIVVWSLLNSRERTLDEFVNLADQAGLEFVKLWYTGETGLVEFQLPGERAK